MVKRDLLEFVKAAVRRPLEVSTVFPTSRALADRLLSYLGERELDRVVELGPGTGAITKYLAPFLPHPERYVGLEINPNMVRFLQESFPQLRFETASGERIAEIAGVGSVDAVVSSLPWTLIPVELQERMLIEIVRSLKPGGVFLTYVCLNATWYPKAQAFHRFLRQHFSSVRKSPVEWRNIPPAFVYICET